MEKIRGKYEENPCSSCVVLGFRVPENPNFQIPDTSQNFKLQSKEGGVLLLDTVQSTTPAPPPV